ncbi:MAG: biotin--[acetyl-CoA-carboxylase] ligase [Pontiellaceae bacterium]|nr:biotin--[acetyl-CoA-carboxylase] ligase [Pontiellaceae bacterium]
MNFRIEWHERLGSTNATLRERFYNQDNIQNGLLIAAHEQTNGRGRQQRTWISTPNSSLCVSFFLETEAPLIQIPSLTMAVALAVSDYLNSRGIRAAPKWPNDVLVGEKKICGILSERVEQNSEQGIIVGLGLNVNMTEAEATSIDRPATSILIEDSRSIAPAEVLEELLPQIDFWISRWKNGGFKAIREIWTEKAGPLGKPLSVHDGDLRKTGTLAGFGEHGELLLKTESGLETIWSGDVE